MRALILSSVLIAMSCAATAQVTASPDKSAAPGSFAFNTSISLNLPLLAADQAGRLAEEETRRTELYARSVRECAILLESIAKSCTITGINVSSQINSSPGQPDYLYASATISMQVALK